MFAVGPSVGHIPAATLPGQPGRRMLGAVPAIVVDVVDVAAGGDGIARDGDGRVVLVSGGVPGDRVRATVVEERPRMLRAEVAEVLEAGPSRTEPPCPHVARGCGGCGWQHVDVAGQRAGKVRIAEESLRRIGRLDGSVDPGVALETEGFRTTLRCLVADGRAGFRAARSHRPVAVESCLVAHPALADLLAVARFGEAEEVVLRVGAATGERMAVVAPTVGPGIDVPGDVTVVGADVEPNAEGAWIHEVVDGRRFRISARSFFQTRADGAAALVAAVRRAADGALGTGTLADLYGGVGLFASTLGEGMRSVLVESSAASVADAAANLADRDASVLRCRMDRWRPEPADLVIADPPRTGLGRNGVRAVVGTGAERAVVVHCDAASFGRDARSLIDAGFTRTSTELVDLFPHTPHVELVSRFDRSTR